MVLMRKVTFIGHVAEINIVPDNESNSKLMFRVMVNVGTIKVENNFRKINNTLIKFLIKDTDTGTWQKVSELYVGDNVHMIVSEDNAVTIGNICHKSAFVEANFKDFID